MKIDLEISYESEHFSEQYFPDKDTLDSTFVIKVASVEKENYIDYDILSIWNVWKNCNIQLSNFPTNEREEIEFRISEAVHKAHTTV